MNNSCFELVLVGRRGKIEDMMLCNCKWKALRMKDMDRGSVVDMTYINDILYSLNHIMLVKHTKLINPGKLSSISIFAT